MNEFNLELHNKVIAQIEKDPENWSQSVWGYGTCRCYGGWALELGSKKINNNTLRRDASAALGLTLEECYYAFNSDRTLEELKALPNYIKSNRENPK